MNNKHILLIFIWACMGIFTSCLKEFLDKAPEAGFTNEEVFGKYENYKQFFDAVYNGRDASNFNNWCIKNVFQLAFDLERNIPMSVLGPECDAGKSNEAQWMKRGIAFATLFSWGQKNVTNNYNPILYPLYSALRVSNISQENINMVKDFPSQEIKYDFLAQTHFVRAFIHFELMRYYGPMPYIVKPIRPDGQWDLLRLGKYEYLTKVAMDFDSAAILFEQAGEMRRDPSSGTGTLQDPEQWRPTGVAAKAYKGRALLYAASPLNNDAGKGQQAWADAAIANWEALQSALQYGYTLLPVAEYKQNMVGAKVTNEQLWAWWAQEIPYNFAGSPLSNGVLTGQVSGFAGEMPFQNTIDNFETSWGDPLNTQADRDKATTIGHYNEQDPYVNRDPRFYIDVIYNGAPVTGFPNAEIFHFKDLAGVVKWGWYQPLTTVLAVTHTGYYTAKRWSGASINNQILTQLTDPLIRLAEVYLNYAEAANEAYGPNTPAPGATLSAVQAINIIRARVGQADVLPEFTTTTEVFRERIKNERNVELAFEGGHYRHDILRWMDAPAKFGGTSYNMDIERVPVSPQYPIGFKHTRVPADVDRQSIWRDNMWYWPFRLDDSFKMKIFVPNPQW